MTGADITQTIITVAVAIGIPAFLGVLAQGIYRQITGRAARERTRDTNIEAQRVKAIRERDQYDASRRKALEYASKLRGDLSEHGIDPGTWPTDLDRTLSRAEIKARRNKQDN